MRVSVAGAQVYRQFYMRQEQKKFFRKVRRFYDGQPLAHSRVMREIGSAMLDDQMSTDSLVALAGRLFKGNQYLHDCFLALIPEAPYPPGLLPEAEVTNLEDLAEQNDEDGGEGGAEVIHIDANDAEAGYGGENCPCR